MNRRDLLSRVLVGAASMHTVGCGTILHQERIDRPHSRDIDWKIAALNGLGLAFFFVPGVIAFVVDFYTGAIYLPPEGYATKPALDLNTCPPIAGSPPQAWERRDIPTQRLVRPSTIEQVVAEESGQEIVLADAGTRVSRMSDWRECGRQLTQHQTDRSFGVPFGDFIRKIKATV